MYCNPRRNPRYQNRSHSSRHCSFQTQQLPAAQAGASPRPLPLCALVPPILSSSAGRYYHSKLTLAWLSLLPPARASVAPAPQIVGLPLQHEGAPLLHAACALRFQGARFLRLRASIFQAPQLHASSAPLSPPSRSLHPPVSASRAVPPGAIAPAPPFSEAAHLLRPCV